ncbi:MAG: lytic transglycosylase domain-containing protein [Pseudomonadota bacterium]
MAKPHRLHTRLASFLTLWGVLALAASVPLVASCLHSQPLSPARPADWVAEVNPPLARPVSPAPRRPWQEPPLLERQLRYWPVVRRLSEREGMDPALVMAVVHVESGFDPGAESGKGAKGLMQIAPATAEELGLKNPSDPEANLKAGIRYLSSLQKTFQNDLVLTLAAYNAGPGKVQRAGRAMPDIEETRDFVSQVLAQADTYRSQLPGLATRRPGHLAQRRPLPSS